MFEALGVMQEFQYTLNPNPISRDLYIYVYIYISVYLRICILYIYIDICMCVYMHMYIRNTHFTRATVKTLAAASLSNALQSMEAEDCYLKWGDYSLIFCF